MVNFWFIRFHERYPIFFGGQSSSLTFAVYLSLQLLRYRSYFPFLPFFFRCLTLASSILDLFSSRGRMNSWSGTQKTLTKSNKFLCPLPTCGCPTSSLMNCKNCCCCRRHHHHFCSFVTLVLNRPALVFLSLTRSVDVGKSPDIPYVYVTHDGLVRNYKPIQVVTACTLNIYNFPFDVQKCSLTFQSWLHTSKTFITH